MSLFAELKRRNVIKVGIAYVVVAWLVAQVLQLIFESFGTPDWVMKTVLVLLAAGLIFALFFAWAFELTPEGLKRESDVDRSQSITPETGHKLNRLIVTVLVLAVAYFAYDKFFLSRTGEPGSVADAAGQADEGAPGEAVPADLSIAVLPFVNLSSDPEQEFFSDGISEELLNVLAQFPGLRVAARTSSFQFKGQNLDIANIAKTLNVAHVLEGSVRKSGSKVRITAQLIKADDGFHLWSKTYDRELTDIFAIQDEISAAIGDALTVELELEGGAAQAHRPHVIEAANPQAYEAYLRGRQLINRRGRESIEEAVRSLEKSLRLDSEYAPAHAQLAIATALLMRNPSSYGDLTLDEVISRATPHIQKALTLAPDLAEAHGAQAILAIDRLDYMAALEHTRRALELNPSYTDAMNWQYLAVAGLGRYREMKEVMERLLAADPLAIVGQFNYITILGAEGDVAGARKIADNLLEQFPWAGYVAHGAIAQIYEGQVAAGLDWYLRAFAVDPADTLSNAYLLRLFVYAGLYNEARRVDDDLAFLVYAAEGNEQAAVEHSRRRMEGDFENPTAILDHANILHRFGRFAEARPLYEELLAKLPGRPIQDLLDNSAEATVRLAFARRLEGDEEGFRLAVQLVTRDLEARAAGDVEDQYSHRSAALVHAVQGNPAGAMESIRRAIEVGMRDPSFFDDPVLESISGDPDFESLEAQIDDFLVVEKERILQLICFDNPVPGAWQPLPATCERVEAAGP